MKDEIEKTLDQRAEEFEAILKQTDWYYEFASGDAYQRGRDSFSRASAAYKEYVKVDPEKAHALWKKYCRSY